MRTRTGGRYHGEDGSQTASLHDNTTWLRQDLTVSISPVSSSDTFPTFTSRDDVKKGGGGGGGGGRPRATATATSFRRRHIRRVARQADLTLGKVRSVERVRRSNQAGEGGWASGGRRRSFVSGDLSGANGGGPRDRGFCIRELRSATVLTERTGVILHDAEDAISRSLRAQGLGFAVCRACREAFRHRRGGEVSE